MTVRVSHRRFAFCRPLLKVILKRVSGLIAKASLHWNVRLYIFAKAYAARLHRKVVATHGIIHPAKESWPWPTLDRRPDAMILEM